MINHRTRAAVFALAMAMPVAMHAQRGMGPRMGRTGGNPVAPLIDMRRELNLSARQLTQLDSIERSLLQRNQGLRDRLRSRLDSMTPRTRGASEAEIQAFRVEGDSLRALRDVMVRNDSVARMAAMSVLTDSQRVRVRERVAERRGFAAGRMSRMRDGDRGFRQGRRSDAGIGPRMRGPGGRMGMGGRGQGGRMGMGGRGQGGRMGMGGRGMIGPRDEMRGPDGLGPRRFDDRRRDPLGGAEIRPRFRRPPPDSAR